MSGSARGSRVAAAAAPRDAFRVQRREAGEQGEDGAQAGQRRPHHEVEGVPGGVLLRDVARGRRPPAGSTGAPAAGPGCTNTGAPAAATAASTGMASSARAGVGEAVRRKADPRRPVRYCRSDELGLVVAGQGGGGGGPPAERGGQGEGRLVPGRDRGQGIATAERLGAHGRRECHERAVDADGLRPVLAARGPPGRSRRTGSPSRSTRQRPPAHRARGASERLSSTRRTPSGQRCWWTSTDGTRRTLAYSLLTWSTLWVLCCRDLP